MATEQTTRHTSGFKTWRTRIASGRITHAQAVQFCHAIQSRADGYTSGGKSTNVATEEARELVDLLLVNPLVVDAAASERGRQWLAKNEKRLGLPHLAWGDIVRFTFREAYDHGSTTYRGNYGPTYRAEWADGSAFEYAPTAWQAGGSDRYMWWRECPAPGTRRANLAR
jgi:hypothetical protein